MILKHVDVSHMIWHVMPCHVSHTKTPHHMPFVVLFFVLELTLNVKEAVEDVGHAITKLASFLNLEVATNSHEPVENPQQQRTSFKGTSFKETKPTRRKTRTCTESTPVGCS